MGFNVVLLAAVLALTPAAVLGAVATLSFTVMGQPNIGIGFADVDTSTCAGMPLLLGSVTEDGLTTNVSIECETATETLSITFNGTGRSFVAAEYAEWSFNAAQQINSKFVDPPSHRWPPPSLRTCDHLPHSQSVRARHTVCTEHTPTPLSCFNATHLRRHSSGNRHHHNT
jgi:hypothetical protein